MGPDREPLIRYVAIECVEVAMEGVEIERIGGLERHACERNHDHECAGLKRNRLLVYVSHVGDESLWRELP
jgi:hypothetical protein